MHNRYSMALSDNGQPHIRDDVNQKWVKKNDFDW